MPESSQKKSNKKIKLEEKEPEEVIEYQKNCEEKYCDMILCVEDEGQTFKFGASKMMLICHSTFFRKEIEDNKEFQDSTIIPQMKLTESVDIIRTFLKIICGNQFKINGNTFDHWVQVIEMGHKFGANMVVDYGLLFLCEEFQGICGEGMDTKFMTKYCKAAVLKLLNYYSCVSEEKFKVSDMTISRIEDVFAKEWIYYCKRCGITIEYVVPQKSGKSSTNVPKATNLSNNHQSSPCKLSQFVTSENLTHFTAGEILTFSNFLEEYMVKENTVLELLEKWFGRKDLSIEN